MDATAIGFVLGPRINAAGRLKHANLSYDLLTAPDTLTARPLAEELAALNRERQNLTLTKVELAQQQIAADRDGRGERGDRYLYLVAHPDFESGIVGLVAGRLVEDLYRPVLVAKVGDEETHGSARSISEFNITAALDECRELLVRHGGHAAAAGFAVKNENLETLRARLEAIAERELAGATSCHHAPWMPKWRWAIWIGRWWNNCASWSRAATPTRSRFSPAGASKSSRRGWSVPMAST